jgi:hypothetical protein
MGHQSNRRLRIALAVIVVLLAVLGVGAAYIGMTSNDGSVASLRPNHEPSGQQRNPMPRYLHTLTGGHQPHSRRGDLRRLLDPK